MNKKYKIENLKEENFSLVLSGGAAYGLAHIGVLKFLEDNNLKADEVLGTSMGAIISALYAIGKRSDEILELLGGINIHKLMKLKYIHGHFSYQKLYDFFDKIYEGKLMSDTRIDLKIIATDLDTGLPKVFSREDNVKISECVVASMCIPGAFEPREINGEFYVDGGVSSNLPVEFAKSENIKLCQNVINKTKKYNYHKKVNLFSKIKGIMNTLKFTVHFLLENQTKAKLKYIKKIILLEPNLNKYKKYSINNYKEVANCGLIEAKEYFK